MNVKFQVVPHNQPTGVAFPVTVFVTSADKTATVEISLSQAKGKAPTWTGATKTVTTDGFGAAAVSFDVALNGPCVAYLTATAYVAASDAYDVDTEPVTVV
ncbi:MAG TPA: hypothetical protein VHW23_42840 [Kofleriaceae bacterium]|jgi:hypothetical protein|nr:hypothetical protein [Kofleriaceae bacterium]